MRILSICTCARVAKLNSPDSRRFLSGSHKAAFTRPPSFDERDSTVWDDYSCPAGSCVVFTESLPHTGATWSNEATDRLSLFTCCK